MPFSYHKSAERPAASIWWLNDAGTLIDFSSGYTFVCAIGYAGGTALLSKSSNITGAAGAGVEPTGTPNLVISWAAGELNLTPGTYDLIVTATSSALDRVFQDTITIRDVMS